MSSVSEIVLYQSDNSIQLEVRMEDETVWLTQTQIAELFEKERSVITKHINNVFKEGELNENSNVHFLHIANSDKPIKLYNLDVIISVGYRVKSKRGTQFRIWANSVLKDYLLKGYSINKRLENLEQRVSKTEDKIEFFVKTSLPPVQGIFFDGQIFDAYKFVSDLVKSARESIILIDNYVDESVFTMLSKRNKGVVCEIFTNKISNQIKLDLEKFNSQYEPIILKEYTKSHDRFLILDNVTVYHIGASLKDLGKKWFAFSKINLEANMLIERILENK